MANDAAERRRQTAELQDEMSALIKAQQKLYAQTKAFYQLVVEHNEAKQRAKLPTVSK